MPAETGERKPAKGGGGGGMAPPAEQEHLQCPRCESTNTKFCYYNNYNFSQPRYFCKSCRRYWTHGGTLRDIPVGGATRKNAKRSRILPPSSASTSHTGGPFLKPAVCSVPGSFTSLLSPSPAGPGGFLALGGMSLGFEDSGFGRPMWPFPELGYVTSGNGDAAGMMNTWQMETGAGDCFYWPELAISPPGNGFKKERGGGLDW